MLVAGDHGRHHHLCQRDLPGGEGAQPGDHVRTIESCILNFLYPFPNNLVGFPHPLAPGFGSDIQIQVSWGH